MEYTVRIIKKGKVYEKRVEEGTNLLDFLYKNRIYVNAHCNGHGTCGKCKIRVSGSGLNPKKKEAALLGGRVLEKGFRLACYHKINSDIDIYLDESVGQAVIVEEGWESAFDIDPFISKINVNVGIPDIEDQKPLIDRIIDASNGCKPVNSIQILRELPETLKNSKYNVTLVCLEKRIIAIEQGNTRSRLYGAAFDIGTTTIVGYLADLSTGSKIAVKSTLNPQRMFGADVISRIKYTGESQESFDEMNRILIECINDIIGQLLKEKDINASDIYMASFVGNTAMMHFLMNIPAGSMAVSPFIPVTTNSHKIKAGQIGIKINENGYALVLPSVSAYVGADTVAAVLSSRMCKSKKITLLIDIGTNGEMVLGNSKWLYTCSTAAGPAFEGASIRNGIGGIEGAIDKVSYDRQLNISTIAGKKAVGICGSGVVDAVSVMVETGLCDKSGRIMDPDDLAEVDTDLKSRIISIDGVRSFLLSNSEECEGGIEIALTQKDIREVQNAKAAIAAGIRVLVDEVGINMKDIDRVYLAGSFGSYINIKSAHVIGLIPAELEGKVSTIGNAAGVGALQGLLSVKMTAKAEKIKKSMKYIELSSSEHFMTQFIECMAF
jgi:uncharacterized 2Fe-2S/4Fe-4S cluster protein (DUF4445 family)